jgi:hypothetical protein
MDNKAKKWLLVFSLLFISGIALGLYFRQLTPKGTYALIKSDGEILEKIELDAVTSPYEFTVISRHGQNTIRVENGRISVVSADCPDKICVQHPPISGSFEPIVCLPNKLVISIEDES